MIFPIALHVLCVTSKCIDLLISIIKNSPYFTGSLHPGSCTGILHPIYLRYLLSPCLIKYLLVKVPVAEYVREKAVTMDKAEPQRPSTLQNVRIGSKRSLGESNLWNSVLLQ